MKIEFPALQSEPLIYFLVHGGVFVLVMGTLFFILGLWLGSAIWGRYKVQAKAIRAENEAQREEIATLKRKLAEQSMRTSTGPLPPVPHLLTEVLPNVSAIFPERRFEYPALAALPSQMEHEKKAQPIQEKPVARKPATKAKIKKETPVVTDLPVASVPAVTLITEEAEDLEPFSFLLPEPEEAHTPSTSALTAIIKGSATTPLTLLPEVSTPHPEVDPALGLLYREPPPDADDLTKIKGIATVLEKRLHELGIHTYQQIASWEDRHVREFSSRLAFKDRIARERWVEQARALNEARQSA